MEERDKRIEEVATQDSAEQPCGGESKENTATLQQVFSCLKRKCRCTPKSRLQALLIRYFMPRHEDDAVAYMKRYKKLCELPQQVEELLNKKRKQSHENELWSR